LLRKKRNKIQKKIKYKDAGGSKDKKLGVVKER